jgi:hypothetical protein
MATKKKTEKQISAGKTLFGKRSKAGEKAHNAAVNKAKKSGIKGDKKLYSIGMKASAAAKRKIKK